MISLSPSSTAAILDFVQVLKAAMNSDEVEATLRQLGGLAGEIEQARAKLGEENRLLVANAETANQAALAAQRDRDEADARLAQAAAAEAKITAATADLEAKAAAVDGQLNLLKQERAQVEQDRQAALAAQEAARSLRLEADQVMAQAQAALAEADAIKARLAAALGG